MSETIRTWIADPVVGRIATVGVGLLVIWAVVATVNRRLTPRIEDLDARYRTRKTIGFLGVLVAGLFLLSIFSTGLASFTVAFGVAGAGIAFALQEVIASVAGWMAIMAGNFFRVGDRVRLGGIRGDVIDIGVLRTTLMECGDWIRGDLYNGRIVRIANSFVFKEPVFNYSADFPFLWDEITIPLAFGSDRGLARRLLGDALEAEVGAYARTAAEAWTRMVQRYRIEDAQVTPMVAMVGTDVGMQYTARYVVDYKERRMTRDRLLERILTAIEATDGRVRIASPAVDVVGVPPFDVRLDRSPERA